MQQQFASIIDRLLTGRGLKFLAEEAERLTGDGSDRQFFRLSLHAAPFSLIAVLPLRTDARDLQEAGSAFSIAGHLYRLGVPVPRTYGFDPESGCLLFEDAGDRHLSDYLRHLPPGDEERENVYRRVLDILLHMQIAGSQNFRSSMCYDAPVYDHRTMVEREGLYFVRAFGRDFLGIDIDENRILPELHRLAASIEDLLGPHGGCFFLHRDFQSRNIMVLQDGTFRVLDFQAARNGPLAYDLASLLIDPYADLADDMQQRLFGYYCESLRQRCPDAVQTVVDTYPALVLQRNMQMLGAFAFLSQKKNKNFFEAFIPVAMHRLVKRLAEDWAGEYAYLQEIARRMENYLLGYAHE